MNLSGPDFRRWGCKNFEQYNTQELRQPSSCRFRYLVSIDEALITRPLPALGDAWRRGRVSVAQARELIRVMTPDNGQEWLERAARLAANPLEGLSLTSPADPDDLHRRIRWILCVGRNIVWDECRLMWLMAGLALFKTLCSPSMESYATRLLGYSVRTLRSTLALVRFPKIATAFRSGWLTGAEALVTVKAARPPAGRIWAGQPEPDPGDNCPKVRTCAPRTTQYIPTPPPRRREGGMSENATATG